MMGLWRVMAVQWLRRLAYLGYFLSLKNMPALGSLSTHFHCQMCTYIILSYSYNLYLKYLTCAHKTSRVRVPSSIWCAHCPCLPSWDKPWVTSEEYLSTLQCVLICLNGTISRVSGITTVYWREKVMSNKQLKCSEKEGQSVRNTTETYP